MDYINACKLNTPYCIEEDCEGTLKSNLYAAVVGHERIDTIVSGMLSTYQCLIDPCTALAFGSLQDYRSQTGINNDTFILSKYRTK